MNNVHEHVHHTSQTPSVAPGIQNTDYSYLKVRHNTLLSEAARAARFFFPE